MRGTARNAGSAGVEFEIRPFYTLAGLGLRGGTVGPVFLRLAGGETRRWAIAAGTTHGHPVGTPITSCSPRVSVVPPPNPDD